MGTYAKVVDGIVTRTMKADADFFESFVDDSPGNWIQCSWNTIGGIHYNQETNEPSEDQSKALRKNMPSAGYTYDANRDAFIPPKPFNSWVLDEQSCLWEPPIPKPDNRVYKWNETTQSWDLVIGG
jgi:hypothetical protein